MRRLVHALVFLACTAPPACGADWIACRVRGKLHGGHFGYYLSMVPFEPHEPDSTIQLVMPRPKVDARIEAMCGADVTVTGTYGYVGTKPHLVVEAMEPTPIH